MTIVPPPFRHCPACGVRLPEPPSTQDLRCAACGFRYFHNVATGVAAFVRCADRLLVVRRAHEPAAGTCDLPGGFVAAGETLEDALARELAEELALPALPALPVYLFSLPNHYRYAEVDYATTDVFFEIACAEMPAIAPGDDVSGAEWLPLDTVVPHAFGLISVQAAVARYRAARGAG